MSNASKFNDSGSIHVRMVEPRTLSVGNDTGFLPRLHFEEIETKNKTVSKIGLEGISEINEVWFNV
jgi:hypothetical protein